MQELQLNSNFVLKFKMKKSQQKKVEEMLSSNGYICEQWVRTPFDNIIEFRVVCNLRKAEALRLLLKNFTVYE